MWENPAKPVGRERAAKPQVALLVRTPWFGHDLIRSPWDSGLSVFHQAAVTPARGSVKLGEIEEPGDVTLLGALSSSGWYRIPGEPANRWIRDENPHAVPMIAWTLREVKS